ncbi:cupredoxin domain-containing protein [Pontibacterium granulatum]|uniref:cupredoxin domain-containing protein n=1 Tax=Pontibacterium granulatum TaxID=2036029 RepID=UPI00249BDB4C|nr:cupredoxin domain-containing protein [Pontibacterium granulatum]MDI3326309.1 cupredoxin domain-containing protein [Pontibacterium granulatum]
MIIVNLIGLVLIVVVVWWFWLYKVKTPDTASGEVIIKVENGVYEPALIRMHEGEKITLIFLRKDRSACSSVVQFDALELSEELPLDKTKSITLDSLDTGSYSFNCQMQMYKGKLIVEDKKNG